MSFRLYKKEKLCSVTAINTLYSRDAANYTAASYPLRAFWRYNPGRHSDAPVQFLISVPKKRLRHAVDRVLMRRRIREAYRLNRDTYPLAEGTKIDVVFLYVDSKLNDYARISRSMERILDNISHHTYDQATAPESE